MNIHHSNKYVNSFPQEKSQPEFYTVKELAKILRQPGSSIYRLIYQGKIPVVRMGSKIHIPKNVLKAEPMEKGQRP